MTVTDLVSENKRRQTRPDPDGIAVFEGDGTADGEGQTWSTLYGIVQTEADSDAWLAGAEPWTIASLHVVGAHRHMEIEADGRTPRPFD
jgi:hypothetical protein